MEGAMAVGISRTGAAIVGTPRKLPDAHAQREVSKLSGWDRTAWGSAAVQEPGREPGPARAERERE